MWGEIKLTSTRRRRYPFTGRDSKETEYIMGSTLVEDEEQDAELSHPQSAEMVEELEESIWSVVRQKMNVHTKGKMYRI